MPSSIPIASRRAALQPVVVPRACDPAPAPGDGACNTSNASLFDWVTQVAEHCQPDNVFWCDGSEIEKALLTRQAVSDGVLIPLSQEKRPGCYLHRSNPNDVARVEDLTFICCRRKEDAGATNNWSEPAATRERLDALTAGAMRGRTLYVIPYLMGPPGSPYTRVGVEITDSIYVVLSMRLMTRMGEVACRQLGTRKEFHRGLHCMLDSHPDRRCICHFPEENLVISVGSNYGGNVLLSKKCFALRLGSALGQREGWLAEHMLLLAIESPQGERTYIAAAFPSACGKTNLSMLVPPAAFEGWSVRTLGDDIAWLHPHDDGRLWAINPEAGYFGVLPGTNSRTNPNAVASISHDAIFTNAALLPDGDVWWEGKDGAVPEHCLDWKGQPWSPGCGTPAAHPNSRFTVSMHNNPVLAPEVNHQRGVPISAIIFGGRRASTVPLALEAFDWEHGVYLGATMSSETTAAAVGQVGVVRRDPMAMRPFCGYDMARYFQHWIEIRRRLRLPPRLFHVNWFRKDATGRFLWPGFSENMRVLKWIVDRCNGAADAEETALGYIPTYDDLELRDASGLSREAVSALQKVSRDEWQAELAAHDEFLRSLGPHVPLELQQQRQALAERLQR